MSLGANERQTGNMARLTLKRPPENIAEEVKTEPPAVRGKRQPPPHTRFARVYDLISDGIRIIDCEYNILYLNRGFSALVGVGLDVHFGAKCYDVFPNQNCNTSKCPLKRVLSGEDEVESTVVRECADGRKRSGTFKSRPLMGADRRLAGMITGFKDTTEVSEARQALEQVQQLLGVETRMLEEKRIALREVLSQIEDEKKQMSLRIQANLDQAVLPLIHNLARKLGPRERQELSDITKYLEDVLSPFVSSLTRQFATLTPREIEVCNFIKNGLSSKEIASRINVSEQTVFKQRRNIRKKLSIADGETNLSAYLQSF